MPHLTNAKEASEEMSQPKHTPGPWKLDIERKTRIRGARKDIAVALVSTSEKFTLSQLEAEANARLIASAPELLQALTLGLEYWSHRQQRYKNRSPVWVQQARTAIAKAIGQQLNSTA